MFYLENKPSYLSFKTRGEIQIRRINQLTNKLEPWSVFEEATFKTVILLSHMNSVAP